MDDEAIIGDRRERMQHKLAILVGGGPAPGINSVIGAATIRAKLQDIEVLGIRDGFEWIMKGDIDHVLPLRIEDVSRIHFRGGSYIGIEKNLMVDAKTTSRWYYLIAMGRKAGHLALGIGKAAGATITLIPEEFSHQKVRLKPFVDTLAGSVIKRMSYGRRDGVAIIAEGLVLKLDPQDLTLLDSVERDAHRHLRLDGVNIRQLLKDHVRERLKELGLKTTIVARNI